MKKLKIKYFLTLVFIINVLIIYKTPGSFAADKYISGKVVYSDDLSPVSSGNVKVFKYSELSKSETVFEIVPIKSNGEFKIMIEPLTADGIKIMAYPNSLDNIQVPFEKKVIEYDVAFENSVNESGIIIEVQRTKSNQSQGKADFEEKNNIILKQNFPNPFNPTTSIRFDLPATSNVTLKVYNMNGANVATLVENKKLKEGLNELEFNAGDLPSGIYIYRLNAGPYTENGKMILVK